MADAAGVDLDPDLAWTWFRDVDLGDFELRICRGDTGDLHRGHIGTLPQAVGVCRAKKTCLPPTRWQRIRLAAAPYLFGR